MRTLIVNLFFLVTASIGYASNITVVSDSVGIEKINGKEYIIHEVEQKETLYALSRRYGAPVRDIITANPTVQDGLEIGQRIKIPIIIKINDQSTSVADKYHTVAHGETLFSISRQYEMQVTDIKQLNNLTANDLEIGQRLKISDGDLNKSASKIPEQIENAEPGKLTHIVKQSETLFSISRTSGVSVSKIKEWNNLTSNDLSIGQELVIGVKEKTTDVVEEVKTESGNTIVDKSAREDDPFKESRVPDEEVAEAVDNGGTATKTHDETGVKSDEESVKITKINEKKDIDTDFKEIKDSGLAELIEGSSNTRKYLAMHRTAKIGTIMKVKNEMNGQEVFVRVLGQLPDTDINKNVLIKISKAAYNRLGAIDAKFRVSISYIP